MYAVEVALLLGQPLLLTGEPGTGKTTLAASLANERFNGRLLEMQVKSDSSRNDLLYRIDEMGIFRDSQPGRKPRRLLDYVTIQPLGEAILRACPPGTALCNRAGEPLTGHELMLDDMFGVTRPRVPTVSDLMPDKVWKQAERVVVLVDEIDKAPRDTPNDLLEEFDRMSFALPEFNLSVRPPRRRAAAGGSCYQQQRKKPARRLSASLCLPSHRVSRRERPGAHYPQPTARA
jgi:MoxR-like ATPase